MATHEKLNMQHDFSKVLKVLGCNALITKFENSFLYKHNQHIEYHVGLSWKTFTLSITQR